MSHSDLLPTTATSVGTILYFSEPLLGQGDISHRIQEALWTSGYPIATVNPARYGFSTQTETFWEEHCSQIVDRYEPQILLISARFTASPENNTTLISLLQQRKDACKHIPQQTLIIEDGWLCSEEFLNSSAFDEIVCLSRSRQKALEARGIPCRFLPYIPSKQYLDMDVAEENHARNVILCVQDATPERIAYLEQLLQTRTEEQSAAEELVNDLHVECYGQGWEGPFGRAGLESEFVFAAHNCYELVIFNESRENDTSLVCRITLPLVNGTSVHYAPDCSLPLKEHIEHDLVPVLSSYKEGDTTHPSFEDCLHEIVGHAKRVTSSTPTVVEPPRYVLILGYFGWGNFGDELILDTIARQIRSDYPHCIPVAVSEKPCAVFSRHGILSVALSDREHLSFYMEHAACMLICAGLLFDIGIYYTSGRRSLLENPDYTDLPGLTAACTLARLYDLPVLFYGAGAGPLVNTESKALVRFMGELGVRFLMRDETSADYIRAAGIREEQVTTVADIAFSSKMPSGEPALQWGVLNDVSFTSQRVIVVSLRRWTGLPGDFECRMATVFDKLLSHHSDFCVLFVSFDPSDVELHEKIYQEMIRKDKAVLYGLAEYTPEVLSILASSYTGVAMRLHCSILMNTFGRPTIGLNYLEKVQAQYQSMGQQDILLPLDASAEQLQKAFNLLLKTYGKRTAEIIQAVDTLRKRLKLADSVLDENLTAKRALAYPTDCYFRKS
jgi:polysaccharide pyruvyl transferase WcaK-like protein